MRIYRRLIALLLALALPLHAAAALGLWTTCPTGDGRAQVVAGGDCCDTTGAPADEDGSTPSCKSGSTCKPGSQFHAGPTHRAEAGCVPAMPAAVAATPVLSESPPGVWRPPRTFSL